LENDWLLYLTYYTYNIAYILLDFTFLDIFPLQNIKKVKLKKTAVYNIMFTAVALYRAELIRAKTYFYRSKQLLKNVCLVRPRFFVIYTIRSRRWAREKSVRDGVNVDGGGCSTYIYIYTVGEILASQGFIFLLSLPSLWQCGVYI